MFVSNFVFVIFQATVEAFFLVHAAPTHPDDKKKVQQKETRIEQLSHIQEQPLVPLSEVTEEERSGLFTLFYMHRPPSPPPVDVFIPIFCHLVACYFAKFLLYISLKICGQKNC